jgi:radical SAM superfamily enzyme YgiQ (UPF0313 family)
VSARPSTAFVNASVGFSDRRKSKPIGLAYIMAFLARHGFESTGFDFGDATDPPTSLAERFGLDRYDVVGFSVYNESFLVAVEMARWIKQRRPETLIVVGGPHATAVHDHIARRYECFDVIVRREGEHTMLEILQSLGDQKALRRIPGTTHRQPHGLGPRVNPDRDLVEELDELPFPDAEFISHSGYPAATFFDEVEGRLKQALTICSSRSCPYDCSFCGVLTIGRKYRSHEAQRIVDELLYFRERHGVHYEHVYFSDANFFVSPKRALAIARALHATDPRLTFSFGTRVNQITRAARVLPELKQLGLRFVELGIESASPDVLERLSKRVEPQMNSSAVRLLARLGIAVAIDFIMIDPASTLDDLRANLAFLRQEGFYDYVPHEHLYSALVLYEGTPIRRFYEQRFGVEYDPDLLPSPYDMFERAEVQRFSNELQRFRRSWQVEIDDVLADLERAAIELQARADADRALQAEMQLDAVSLRHAPNLFFEALLDDAARGFPVADAHGAEQLIPLVGHDRVPLRVLLDRARTLAARIDAAAA